MAGSFALYHISKYFENDILRLATSLVFGTTYFISVAFPLARSLAARNKASRPNIIFILGDNHNADAMGCAGHPFIRTPGLDRLAREGIRFREAFNTTSLCSPSRTSILTGAYAHKHGVKNNLYGTPEGDRLLPKMKKLLRGLMKNKKKLR